MPEYYLKNPGGNDTNDGSQGAPWLTMQKAMDTATSGDAVYLCGSEIVNTTISGPKNSGVLPAPIKFVGVNSEWEDDGTKYVLDCNDNNLDGLTLSGDRDHAIFKNIEIKNADGDGISFSSGSTNRLLFWKVHVHGCSGTGLNLSGGVDDSTILQCTVNDCFIGIRNGQNNIFYSEVFGNAMGGIALQSGNVTLIGNIVYRNGSNNISINASDITLIQNVVDDSSNGIRVTTSGTNLVAFFNRITNNIDGIDQNASNNVLIENWNVFSRNANDINNNDGFYESLGNSRTVTYPAYIDKANGNFNLSPSSSELREPLQIKVGCK